MTHYSSFENANDIDDLYSDSLPYIHADRYNRIPMRLYTYGEVIYIGFFGFIDISDM